MSQSDCPTYRRAVIEMTLVVRSPLHVGTGERALLVERVPEGRTELLKQMTKGDKSPTYRPMAMRRCESDHESTEKPSYRAYVPGPTIKGALRALLSSTLDEAQDREIFGVSDGGESEDSANRQIGRVRFTDSSSVRAPGFDGREPPLWSAERGTAVSGRVAIDPITGTAAEHQLTFFEFVPEGSELDIKLEASNISEQSLKALGQALASMRARAFRLGAGAALCAGELELSPTKSPSIKVLRQDKFVEWIKNSKTESGLNGYAELPLADEEQATPSNEEYIKLELITLDPLLIASGLDKAEKHEGSQEKTDEHSDHLSVMQTPGGHIRIPASTMRGALRARARKILILWIHEHWRRLPDQAPEQKIAAEPANAFMEAGRQADKLLESLFGSINRVSTLQISEFLSIVALQRDQLHHQYFNAIDRFTGGVAKGALYEAWAAPPGIEFTGHLRIRVGRTLPAWATLLLAFLLRDLEMADIAVGWGKAKGYGTLRLQRVDKLTARPLTATLVKQHDWFTALEKCNDRTLFDSISESMPSPESSTELVSEDI